MKYTLVIDSRSGGDFSMDLLWAGLVRRLGPDRIIDYPAHQKHRASIPKWTIGGEEDYGSERRSLGYTPLNHLTKVLDEGAVRSLIQDGLIERIFIDEREESYYDHYLRVASINRLTKDVPVVVVAGHDRFWNHSPTYVKEQYYPGCLEAMFVDDWQPEYDHLSFVHLMNLSTNYDHLWDHSSRLDLLRDKKYDICFMGYNSHTDRSSVLDHVIDRWSHLNNHIILEKRNGAMDRFVSRSEYFTKIAQSKICINVKGASACGRALRYYEIPYVGSFMLTQTFPARLLYPFKPGVHCDAFSSIIELDEKIGTYLADDRFRELLAASGHAYSLEHHTVDARMDYVFGVLDG